eukprot:2230273-Rhodomonas_salina.2
MRKKSADQATAQVVQPAANFNAQELKNQLADEQSFFVCLFAPAVRSGRPGEPEGLVVNKHFQTPQKPRRGKNLWALGP